MVTVAGNIVDGKAGPTRESRALGVHSRSMEIYDQLGVVDRVLAEGYPAVTIRPGYEAALAGALLPLEPAAWRARPHRSLHGCCGTKSSGAMERPIRLKRQSR